MCDRCSRVPIQPLQLTNAACLPSQLIRGRNLVGHLEQALHEPWSVVRARLDMVRNNVGFSRLFEPSLIRLLVFVLTPSLRPHRLTACSLYRSKDEQLVEIIYHVGTRCCLIASVARRPPILRNAPPPTNSSANRLQGPSFPSFFTLRGHGVDQPTDISIGRIGWMGMVRNEEVRA